MAGDDAVEFLEEYSGDVGHGWAPCSPRWKRNAQLPLSFGDAMLLARDATGTCIRRLTIMVTESAEMILVSDEELLRLAEEKGPASAEAQALAQLKTQR